MQPNGMPQFGGQNNNRNNQMAHPVQAAHGGQEPLFSANPNFVATGSAIAEKKKDKKDETYFLSIKSPFLPKGLKKNFKVWMIIPIQRFPPFCF